MIATLVGFAITIAQLVRTKNATKAVSDEIKRIGFAVSKYDATVETSRAETSLQAARKFVKEDDWVRASDALETLAKALFVVKELAVPELLSHADAIDNVMGHAVKLCERLDKVGVSGMLETEKIKTLAILREHDRLPTSLRIALQRSSIGE